MPRIALVFATVLGVLALAPLALAAAKPETLTVTISNLKLTLTGTAHPGKVTFDLVNKGKLARSFRIDGKTSALIAPGKSGKLVVTLKKGSYPYSGTAKGHTALSGKLEISA